MRLLWVICKAREPIQKKRFSYGEPIKTDKTEQKKGMHPGERASKVWNGNLSCVFISTVIIGHTTKDFEFGSDLKNKKLGKVADFFWGKKSNNPRLKKQIILVLFFFLLRLENCENGHLLSLSFWRLTLI